MVRYENNGELLTLGETKKQALGKQMVLEPNGKVRCELVLEASESSMKVFAISLAQFLVDDGLPELHDYIDPVDAYARAVSQKSADHMGKMVEFWDLMKKRQPQSCREVEAIRKEVGIPKRPTLKDLEAVRDFFVFNTKAKVV